MIGRDKNSVDPQTSTFRIDDFCAKCGEVNEHILYAKSLQDNGVTECVKCGNNAPA